ncbi:MAG TPA: alpha/beta hydrolase [Candidatus Dormibacteraeota bacterium]|nr:alpha/beta hydrolase [Candidatus Dormibacteraeota bacterium]
MIEGLARLGREVITFDPPGSGQSPRPPHLDMAETIACAEEALAESGVSGPVPVLGRSQGGVAALALALERPERVGRLLLICASAGGPSFMRAPGAIWNRSHPDVWRFALLAALHVVWPRRAPETLMNNLIFRDSLVDRGRFAPTPVGLRDWLRPPRPRAAWGGRVARRLDYRGRLADVRAPALVIAGRRDPQMPPSCAAELATGIPDARLAVLERSGHYPFIEESAAFWRLVAGFLTDC